MTFTTSEGRFPSDEVDEPQKSVIENYIAALDRKNLQIVSEDSSLRTRITKNYKDGYDKALGDKVADVIHTLYQIRRPGDVSETGGYREQSDDQVTDCASDNTLSCFHGSQVAPVVGQAYLDWVNSTAVQNALDSTNGRVASIALVAAGGVRTNINAGKLYEGNVSLEMLPFSNHLTVISLTGAQIKDIVASTIKPVLDPSAHAGKFPYVAGMRYKFVQSGSDSNDGAFTQFQVKGDDGSGNTTWTDIADATRYNVVIGNYNANGNDGWTALAKAQVDDAANVNRQDLYVTVDSSNPNNVVTTPMAVDVTMSSTTNTDGSVSYKTSGEPECTADNEFCNTDARSFIYYGQNLGNGVALTPLADQTTTMVYQPKS